MCFFLNSYLRFCSRTPRALSIPPRCLVARAPNPLLSPSTKATRGRGPPGETPGLSRTVTGCRPRTPRRLLVSPPRGAETPAPDAARKAFPDPPHPSPPPVQNKNKKRNPKALRRCPVSAAPQVHCLTAKIRKAFPSRGVLRLKRKGEGVRYRAITCREGPCRAGGGVLGVPTSPGWGEPQPRDTSRSCWEGSPLQPGAAGNSLSLCRRAWVWMEVGAAELPLLTWSLLGPVCLH